MIEFSISIPISGTLTLSLACLCVIFNLSSIALRGRLYNVQFVIFLTAIYDCNIKILPNTTMSYIRSDQLATYKPSEQASLLVMKTHKFECFEKAKALLQLHIALANNVELLCR